MTTRKKRAGKSDNGGNVGTDTRATGTSVRVAATARAATEDGTTGKALPRANYARKHYSDDTKIRAVTAVLTTNAEHPLGAQALDAARAIVNGNINSSTLDAWLKQYGPQVREKLKTITPTASEIIIDTQGQVLKRWADIRQVYQDHMLKPEVVDAANAKDSSFVAKHADIALAQATKIPAGLLERLLVLMELSPQLNEPTDGLLDDLIETMRLAIDARRPHLLAPTVQDTDADM